MISATAGRAVYSTSLLESVDAASIEVTPMLAKAYQRVQNGSDIRGVAIAGVVFAECIPFTRRYACADRHVLWPCLRSNRMQCTLRCGISSPCGHPLIHAARHRVQ